MFKTNIIRSFGLLALGALCMNIASCSVKEDRTPCPCYLNVSFQDRDTIGEPVGLLGWKDGRLFSDTIAVADYVPYWTKPVRRNIIALSSFLGMDAASIQNHLVVIPEGSQCDSLYAFHEDVDATGEMAYAEVDFHKQFCTVFLNIYKPVERMQDFRFLVEGNTCGFDLLNFRPVAGVFSYEPVVRQGNNIVDFRIPRQSDDSLTVSIWSRGDNGEWVFAGRYPIGKYIKQLGYDWTSVDLADVYVSIDVAIGRVILSVGDWEDGVVFELIEQ